MNGAFQAVFLDRDGTIGGSDQIEYPGDFKLFHFTEEVIQTLKFHNISVFSFTNQPGISRGDACVEDFISELSAFGFDDVYLCPHHHTESCDCRKPAIGMLKEAASDHNLDLSKCIVIGDRWTDMLAAKSAGCIAILVQTGSGKASWNQNHTSSNIQPDHVAATLKEGVEWLFEQTIIDQEKRRSAPF
ncbi:HAD-IIIA family hydrolase [Fictibacillus sp. 26RED30]|jgi:histidinol-phosphate phosphatase family protein|uniref:HAD-IIIA family hydrolase n=1 Tax=Fictibacillus sp. 26RED30 TaxID=2745877 RepID=UPI0018CDC899|nr:HAD-IIIA family hydrolase [Fictibacillus sp. 26RED30]MBH0161434.1 HAD-IIIA family hydrolase [Fictibacillus sp. 26RED30]